jgi:hypothetical protein
MTNGPELDGGRDGEADSGATLAGETDVVTVADSDAGF